MGLLVLWGVVARWMLLHSQFGIADSDEAIVGLMARHVLEGEFTANFWGQAYGGTQEAILTAGFFRLFGSSTLLLKLVPMIFSAATAFVVWRIGLRTLRSPDAAAVAGAVCWAGPSVILVSSVQAYGFNAVTVFLGALTVLLVLQLGQAAPSMRGGRLPWRWVALGFVVGQGVWASPKFPWVALPALAWLALTRFRVVATKVWWCVPGFLVGAAPWLAYNLNNGWAGLRQTPTPVPENSYLDHLSLFGTDGLPLAMGLRIPYIGDAVPSPTLANFLYGVLLALVAVMAWRGRRNHAVLLLTAVTFPFLLATSKQSFHQIDGHYIGGLVPVLVLLVVGGMEYLQPRFGLALIAVGMAGLGYLGLSGLLGPWGDSSVAVRAIEELHVEHAYGEYWLAYSITFASDERIVITGLDLDRYAPYTADVQRADNPAFIFFTDSMFEVAFRNSLIAHGIDAQRHQISPALVVYLPERKMVPIGGPGYLYFDPVPTG